MTGRQVIVGIDPGLSGALFFLDPGRPSSGEEAQPDATLPLPLSGDARATRNRAERRACTVRVVVLRGSEISP